MMNLERVLVGQVMTPRTRIVAVPSTATLEEAQRVMLDTGRLRLPFYEGTLDEIIGCFWLATFGRRRWRVAPPFRT